ncbi:MAG: BON domain-containing protein [Elainellaceae cyanobacterium]
MSWLERISVQEVSQESDNRSSEAKMSPGLTGQFDRDLREKASFHKPPIPPEKMGVEGEFDPAGLAKRVAIAFDNDPIIRDVQNMNVVQIGRAIVLQGQAPDDLMLHRMVETASQVDGTDVVDTSQVTIAAKR